MPKNFGSGEAIISCSRGVSFVEILSPRRSSFCWVVLPAPGLYDVVFDTPRTGRSGGFRFRFWLGDVSPPTVRVRGVRGRFLEVAVSVPSLEDLFVRLVAPAGERAEAARN